MQARVRLPSSEGRIDADVNVLAFNVDTDAGRHDVAVNAQDRPILGDYLVLGEDLWSRFKGGRESLRYYRELVKCLSGRTHERLHRRLEATVKELHHLAGEVYQL